MLPINNILMTEHYGAGASFERLGVNNEVAIDLASDNGLGLNSSTPDALAIECGG